MKAFPESARRKLRAETPGEHPDADLLAAFAEHTLMADERQRMLSHLAGCASCRAIVSLALADEARAEQQVTPTAKRWFRWPLLRWTAVAATVIVVGAAVSVLVPRRGGRDLAAPATTTSTVTTNEQVSAPAASAQSAQPNEALASNLKKKTQPQEFAKSNKAPVKPGLAALDTAAPIVAGAAQARTAPTETDKLKAFKLDEAKEAVANKDAANAPAKASAEAAGSAGPSQVYGQLASAPQAGAPGPPPPPPSAAPANGLRAGAMATGRDAIGGPIAMAKKAAPPSALRWRVSAAGQIEKSADGTSWKPVGVDSATAFHAVSARGAEIWAGGAWGALFHSGDAGQTWKRVNVGQEGMWVQESITSVEFFSPRAGVVTTASGAVWATQDGGNSWLRRQ